MSTSLEKKTNLYKTIDNYVKLYGVQYCCESETHKYTLIGPLNAEDGQKWRCDKPGCHRNKTEKYKMAYYKSHSVVKQKQKTSVYSCKCDDKKKKNAIISIICQSCAIKLTQTKKESHQNEITIRKHKKLKQAIETFCGSLKLSKNQYYNYCIHKMWRNTKQYATFTKDIMRWIANKPMGVYATNIDAKTKQQLMLQLFQLTFEQLELQIKQLEPKIRFEFREFTLKYLENTIPSTLKTREQKYIEKQNNVRCDLYIEKAKSKLEMKSMKRIKAIWYHGINEHHGINANDPIKMEHILSLICYADNSELCTAFRTTYRRITADKSIDDQKKRHSKYANLGKLIYEAFIFYASKNGEITTLYHGMGIPLVFPTLYCSLDAPTSTTTASSVALSFGNSTGVVMKLVSCESSPHIKTLDMGLFSCFDNEEEHLIFETRLHIQDIFIPTEKCFIGAKLMHSLSLYDLLTHGNIVHEKKLLKTNKQTKLCNVLNSIIKGEKVTTSKYANSLISALTIENSKIWLNMTQINDPELTDDLRSMFIKTDDEDGPGTFMSYLKSNCKHEVAIFPVFVTNWKMSEETFDLIKRASRKFKNVTIEGSALTCILSENKHIKFKPSLHQIENAFVIKMTLVDVSPQMPIKIHFNLICEELNNFYTSLHPQTMDLKSNNSFHIMLPPIVGKIQDLKLIEIKMSIMLHNCKDFGVDYETFRTENAMIKSQNMEHTISSYKLADVLSIFYGVSNSIFSVLDSISDMTFIVLLFHFAEADGAVTDKFLILTIGNLISIAILIALFMCHESKIESRLYMVLAFLMFFILSPILPSFDWIAKRLKLKNNAVVVQPNHDGILLWYQHELTRNKIFIVECIFESCFQFIIQFVALTQFVNIFEIDIYLFLSISISFIVIISKFILISYNLRRKTLLFNVYCYFMDIFFSLIIGIFIASVWLKHSFTLTGWYFVLEFILFVPFYSYYITKVYSMPDWVSIPVFILLFYPILIASFSAFSIFPALSYFQTNSTKIGENQTFYQTMYEYYKKSSCESERRLKIVIINYVCLISYFDSIDEDENEDYYQFAQWLCDHSPSDLQYISLEEFHHYSDHSFTGNNVLYWDEKKAIIINTKIIQILIRVSMVIVSLLLDLCYFETFTHGSSFMNKYGNEMKTLSILAIILLIIWFCWLIYEIFISKWNQFCHNMIAPKHPKFTLLTTIDKLITKCEKIQTIIQESSDFSNYNSGRRVCGHQYATKQYYASKQNNLETTALIWLTTIINVYVNVFILSMFHFLRTSCQNGILFEIYQLVVVIIMILLMLVFYVKNKSAFPLSMVGICFATSIAGAIMFNGIYDLTECGSVALTTIQVFRFYLIISCIMCSFDRSGLTRFIVITCFIWLVAAPFCIVAFA
eukprot:290909_1